MTDDRIRQRIIARLGQGPAGIADITFFCRGIIEDEVERMADTGEIERFGGGAVGTGYRLPAKTKMAKVEDGDDG